MRDPKKLGPKQSGYLTKQQTQAIFNVSTSNGCREMTEARFHQAVNEAIYLYLRSNEETPEAETKPIKVKF